LQYEDNDGEFAQGNCDNGEGREDPLIELVLYYLVGL
jgi:hypothetical protein